MKKINNWEEYKKTSNTHFKSKKNDLNSGTTLKKINAFEEKFNIELPEYFKDIYLKNNGENGDIGYIVGLKFLSIEEIESEMTNLKNIIEKYSYMNDFNGKSIPKKSIKKLYYHEKWVPFIADSQGAYLALDLSPDIHGLNGQIINIGNDENDHFVIANNANDLFSMINNLIIKKGVNKGNVGHLTDKLKSEIIEGYFKHESDYKIEIKKSTEE